MAWTINSVTYRSGDSYYVNWSGQADATDLADQIVVDKSALGAGVSKLQVHHLTIACGGVFARLEWDHTTDDLIVACPPDCTLSYPPPWDFQDLIDGDFVLDPASAGGTGDIVLTTTGGGVGDGISLQMWLTIE